MKEDPGVKVLVNRGLLYLHLKDYSNALLDLVDAGKVRNMTYKLMLQFHCRHSVFGHHLNVPF